MPEHPPTPDGEVLAEHTERMRRLARGLLADYDRAEDVAQEAALLTLTGRVKPRTTLAACLGGVVRNLSWKLRRSERRRGAHEMRAARGPSVPSTADLLERLDEQRRVLDTVRTLAEPYRSTILMRYIDGLPPRQIAARTETPVETVKSRIKRGLAQLRERMDEQHGGRRKAWLPVLFPIAGWDHLLTASTATAATTGGIMAQTASNKLPATIILLLLGSAALWFATDGFGTMSDPGDADGSATTASTEDPLAAGGTLTGREDGTPGETPAPSDATPETPGADDNATADPAETDTPATTRHPVRAPSTLPPVRHSPFAPPPRKNPLKPSGSPGGGGSWGGPTGHWTRFRLAAPPIGTARLKVTVTDESGRPVEDAKVYIGPKDVLGKAAVSYGSLRELGRTDRSGVFKHNELTPGEVTVCANIGALLTGRFGLDTRPATLVTLRNGSSVEAKIQLPLSGTDLGGLEGRITDPHGRPISAVTVSFGNNVVYSKRDGRYRLLRIPAGAQSIGFRSWGWKGTTEKIEIAAGTVRTHDLVLHFKEQGTVSVRGIVVGPMGEPVKGCNVYLNNNVDRATMRDVKTDASGRFEFKDLPERVTRQSVEVQGSGIPRYGSKRITFENGIPDGSDVRVEIEVRFIEVILEVTDAATGEPVLRTRIEAKRLDGEGKKRGGFWYREAKQGHDGILEPGRYRVTVDALDHEGVEFDLDVPHEEPFRHKVKLKRVSPDSVDVHLTLDVHGATEEDIVTKAKIEILDARGEAIARFEGTRDEGRYLLPAPSGKRTLRITAAGFEVHEEQLDLDPAVLEVTKSVQLRAK